MTMPHLMNCAHAEQGWCLDCVGMQWKELENHKALRPVLMELAPFVAVLGRSESVSPECRAELLRLEPLMLKALLETKSSEDVLLEKFPRALWPDGPGGGPYSEREKALQNEHKQRVTTQRAKLGLSPYDWSQW
jgi:hypothetical protein